MLTTFFWCFLVILLFWGVRVVYNLKKQFAGDPQIYSEMTLAKKL